MFTKQLCSPCSHHVNTGDPTIKERHWKSHVEDLLQAHTVNRSSNHFSSLCSKTKCKLLPTLWLWRTSFEEDYCRIIFPMLEINSKFFQAHHEGKVLEDKWIQPSVLHFKHCNNFLDIKIHSKGTVLMETSSKREGVCSGVGGSSSSRFQDRWLTISVYFFFLK